MNAIGILYYEASAVVYSGTHSQASAGEAFSRQTHENALVKDEHAKEFLIQEVITKDEATEVKLEDLHITETQVCFMKPLWLHSLSLLRK